MREDYHYRAEERRKPGDCRGFWFCNGNNSEERRRAENDYKVNLKTEIMIEDLYDKVNAILAKQSALEKRLNAQSGESAASVPSNESKKN